MMNKGDRVKHKTKGWIGLVYSLQKHGALVDWSDEDRVDVHDDYLEVICK